MRNAENAFNTVSEQCALRPCDVEKLLCSEVDTPEDLEKIKEQVKKAEKKNSIYVFFDRYGAFRSYGDHS